ncbi:PP2C family protein-serine/threonine phosphatase [Streptacidiphilus sp. P02-A3a]|uniref:PP2C family protein-serine/threonine phosphatase n=1 Tax=Streptacidiphilus sp. P02-A3a TaxID=2704468 RepID=UPI0015FB8CF4|nr:PP2C family protein-serine/threonine phosphatase [Streptacidiphilus sp. P02-A3a]QMU69315.1 serine/threonine-protein phosphatase [Streptacidiphilus sp. P02-A3a]
MLRSQEDPSDSAEETTGSRARPSAPGPSLSSAPSVGTPPTGLAGEVSRLRTLNSALLAELEETNRGVVALYSEEHQLALTLQRTFLPETLPQVPGTELAVRYLPAASETEIGGDFYEAVETPAGLLLAVGDVMGHSLQAAIVMGELRHALRAYAAEDHAPHVLLERLDALLSRHRPGWTATVCIALVEPDGAGLRIANAGHPPPLLRTASGRTAFVQDHGPLLGLGLPQPEGTRHRLAPGTSLLMVTDGLVEKRGTPMPEAMERLRRVTADGPRDSEALCDTLLDSFGAQQRDDIVVFAARFTAD